MKKWIMAFVCVVGLTGCMKTTAPMQQLPELTYKHLAPIALNVAAIDIIDKSPKVMVGQSVGYLYPTSPKKAVSNWVRDRLVATGATGSALVTINDASAIEEKLVKEDGIKGVFTNDQSERYSTNVDVKIELFDSNGNNQGYASAKANRFITVTEDMSLLEREKRWFEMVEVMMTDFNRVMTSSMNTNLPVGR